MNQFKTPNAHHVLKDNQARRAGLAPVRSLEDGYVAMRIPQDDDPKSGVIGYHTLCKLFPELKAEDPTVRLAAWKNLEASELGDAYRVTEHSPLQVQRIVRRGNRGIIIK